MTDISLVIPAQNERENIAPLVDEIYQVLGAGEDFEIIYVDDGSTDGTFAEIQRLKQAQYPAIKALKHSHNVGQSTAIHSGIIAASGELIITLDADGQNDPSDIPKLLLKAREQSGGSPFCIAGYRKNRNGDTHWKRCQSWVGNKIRSGLLGDGNPDTGCGLKIFPRSTFLKLPYFDHMHRFIPALVRRLGGQVVVVEINHRERLAGLSKYTMLNRLWVSIVDMLGVIWLQRRSKLPTIIETIE